MRLHEIASGLWRWTGEHPDWTPDEEWPRAVGCVYYEGDDAVVLVDPLVPPEDPDRFWRALDRDVERAGRPLHVLLTVNRHVRSSTAIAERYGGEVWAHERLPGTERRKAEPTRTFAFGETLPGGIEPRDAVHVDEAILWIPAHGALVFGDVVLGADGGGVRLCSERRLGAGATHAELGEALRPLLELPVRRLLPSHGEPVLQNGRAELARAL